MKKFLSVLLTLTSIFIISCTENSFPTVDNSSFEKRTPVQKDSLKRKMPVEAVVNCLGLTREQHIIVFEILKNSKLCEVDCKKEFNDSVKIIRSEYNAKMEQYRNVERTDEVKKEIQIITFEFHQILKDLENEYKEKKSDCLKNTNSEIEKVLNESQLKLWNIWLATGKIPCDIVRP